MRVGTRRAGRGLAGFPPLKKPIVVNATIDGISTDAELREGADRRKTIIGVPVWRAVSTRDRGDVPRTIRVGNTGAVTAKDVTSSRTSGKK